MFFAEFPDMYGETHISRGETPEETWDTLQCLADSDIDPKAVKWWRAEPVEIRIKFEIVE